MAYSVVTVFHCTSKAYILESFYEIRRSCTIQNLYPREHDCFDDDNGLHKNAFSLILRIFVHFRMHICDDDISCNLIHI